MKNILTPALLIVTTSFLITGCATPQPHRIETGGTQAITTMGLDPADYMDAAMRVTRELITAPVITQFEAKNGRLARLDYGKISNKTRARIQIEQISERVLEELLSSGQITLVAHDGGAKAASQLRSFMNDEKVSLKNQADFYLEGEIFAQADIQGRVRENNYSFMLRLNDVETESQVWKRSIDVTKQGVR